MNRTYDYIVVGGGSAGAVVAARLCDDADRRVLLIERGPGNGDWRVRIPGATGENYRPGARHLRWIPTEPQPHLASRVIDMPIGHGLGGGSSVNGMVFLRGHALDYARWVAEGAEGWSYAEVLPYFKRMERHAGPPSPYRGTSGPVGVRVMDKLDPLSAAFLEAGQQAGYPLTSDVNGFQQEGMCRFDVNVDGGYRASSAIAYLEPRRRRANLTVLTGALVTRIILDGSRAVGVELAEGRRLSVARAEREVILSAGALGSPQLLMLSGIGPAAELRRHGIETRVDLPGVGRNLHDHIELDLQWACPPEVSYNRLLHPLAMARIGLQWLVAKQGFAAMNQIPVGAFLRSNEEVEHPNIQFHFSPVYMDGWLPRRDISGFRVSAGPMRPTSRGRVALRSADPADRVSLDPNYLATEHDRREMRESYALIEEIVSRKAFDPYRLDPIDPPALPRTAAEIDRVIERYAGLGFHNVGTCKMGAAGDAMAVVDSAARLRGVDGLCVIDGSIMPSIVSSNPNAVIMMMAERLADALGGKPPLPPETLPAFEARGPTHLLR
jgi:choline dehydrogenase